MAGYGENLMATDRSAAAFELAGRGGGYDAGAYRYADTILAGTEAVLRAVVLRKVPRTDGCHED
jgi:hypothetical protein